MHELLLHCTSTYADIIYAHPPAAGHLSRCWSTQSGRPTAGWMPGVRGRRRCSGQSKECWPGGHKPPRQWPLCASPQSHISEKPAGPDAGGDRREEAYGGAIYVHFVECIFPLKRTPVDSTGLKRERRHMRKAVLYKAFVWSWTVSSDVTWGSNIRRRMRCGVPDLKACSSSLLDARARGYISCN